MPAGPARTRRVTDHGPGPWPACSRNLGTTSPSGLTSAQGLLIAAGRRVPSPEADPRSRMSARRNGRSDSVRPVPRAARAADAERRRRVCRQRDQWRMPLSYTGYRKAGLATSGAPCCWRKRAITERVERHPSPQSRRRHPARDSSSGRSRHPSHGRYRGWRYK